MESLWSGRGRSGRRQHPVPHREFLRSGVMENGVFKPTTVGTPQGGVIKPAAGQHRSQSLGRATPPARLRFVRYADDFVVVTPSQTQAEEARKQVEQVLGAWASP